MTVDLFELCIHNRWSEARDYLSSDAAEEEKKSNIMCRHGDGWTCLNLAFCRDDIMKTMIDIGGKELVMMTDIDNCIVLHDACINGAPHNIIKMLIEVGGKDLVMAGHGKDFGC